MTTLFWSLLLLVLYCYFGYPLLLKGVTLFFRRRTRKERITPGISVVLAVWNEEDVIKNKIKNLLSLDYPDGQIEVLIGSDGSTDRTNEIIRQFLDPRIHLIESPERRGKMATLNQLLKLARNEIIVFTDARQTFDKEALLALVANFNDRRIGCVSGELIFSEGEGGTGRGINLYWKYEKFIRKAESDIHSMLGATGAIYAIRRELFSEIPENVVLDDMYIPFQIIGQGYRAVFDAQARAYDKVAENPREEHRRKARTLFGNYQIFAMFPQMFIPLRSPIAVQLFSHKFLRVLIPFFLFIVFIVNAQLAYDRTLTMVASTFYLTAFLFQILFYLMAVIGGLARHQKYGILKGLSKLCYVPYVFCLLNFSALAGFWRFVTAKQEVRWRKARE